MATVMGEALWSRAAALIPNPLARDALIAAERSGAMGLRPDFFEVRRRPAMMRSRIMARSNSAKTPNMPNIALPLGVLVSRPCW